jgi:hypothetical protein
MPMESRFTKLMARHSFAMTIPAREREASADSPLHVLCDNAPFWKIDHGDQLCRTFGAANIIPFSSSWSCLVEPYACANILVHHARIVRYSGRCQRRPNSREDLRIELPLATLRGRAHKTSRR